MPTVNTSDAPLGGTTTTSPDSLLNLDLTFVAEATASMQSCADGFGGVIAPTDQSSALLGVPEVLGTWGGGAAVALRDLFMYLSSLAAHCSEECSADSDRWVHSLAALMSSDVHTAAILRPSHAAAEAR